MRFSNFLISIFLITATGWAQPRPMTVEDVFAMGRVSDPQVSPDGRWIAYTVTHYNMADNSSNSDICLVSADGKQQRQLTSHPKRDAHPRWSADGNYIYFISSRGGSSQVYRIDVRGGEARQLTDLPLSVADFSITSDGQHLAVQVEMYPGAATMAASAKMEKEKSKTLASGRVIDGLMFRHWNAWREGKQNRVVIVNTETGEMIGGTPAENDCPPVSLGSSHDFVWSPNSEHLAFVQNTDPVVAVSTNNDVWLMQRDGQNLRKISQSPGNDNAPLFSPDGRHLAYLSMARAGFEADQQNLMVVNLASGETRNLTASLDRSVSDFAWSPDSKMIYYFVSHHGRHRLYAVNVSGGGSKLLLDRHYISGIAVSPDGKYLVIDHQKSHQPNELFRFDLRSRQLTQLTRTNDALLAKLSMNPIEDYWFSGANGDSVHLLMVKPPDFDPQKKYPLINLIHGGPQGAWSDNYHYRWNSQMFAAPGYVVIMINFHGSRGYGQAFCDAVSKDWGGAPYEDIITGTRWALENFDFIDGERIGAAGASYGGFMINWIAGHNDDGLFKALVSHAGVYEQTSMFGATEELWFPRWEFNGNPWDSESLYQKWNPANHAGNFKTPTLVIHGEHDYRVPYTQGLQMFTALQVNGVPSRLLFFPDEDHFIRKPQNANLWWQTVYEWLGRYLMQPAAGKNMMQ